MIRFLMAFFFSLSAHCQTAMFHNCPPEGTWKTEEDKALNTLKNRFQDPLKLAQAASLADFLRPVNHAKEGADDSARFANSQAVILEGYIVAVKFEGAEGCNCGSMAVSERDFHMWFGLKPDAAKRECMVIEISPRWREARKWSAREIKGWKGHRVRVTGWLFWDPRHANMAVNSTPGAKLLARVSCWEVHPVTQVEVLP